MEDEQPRAGWQVEACPPWCTRQHDDDDDPDDRFHDSVATQVSVVFAHRDHESGPGRWTLEPGEVTIITSRYADVEAAETVTFVGREDRVNSALNLTPASAAAVAEGLARHVASLGDPD